MSIRFRRTSKILPGTPKIESVKATRAVTGWMVLVLVVVGLLAWALH